MSETPGEDYQPESMAATDPAAQRSAPLAQPEGVNAGSASEIEEPDFGRRGAAPNQPRSSTSPGENGQGEPDNAPDPGAALAGYPDLEDDEDELVGTPTDDARDPGQDSGDQA